MFDKGRFTLLEIAILGLTLGVVAAALGYIFSPMDFPAALVLFAFVLVGVVVLLTAHAWEKYGKFPWQPGDSTPLPDSRMSLAGTVVRSLIISFAGLLTSEVLTRLFSGHGSPIFNLRTNGIMAFIGFSVLSFAILCSRQRQAWGKWPWQS